MSVGGVGSRGGGATGVEECIRKACAGRPNGEAAMAETMAATMTLVRATVRATICVGRAALGRWDAGTLGVRCRRWRNWRGGRGINSLLFLLGGPSESRTLAGAAREHCCYCHCACAHSLFWRPGGQAGQGRVGHHHYHHHHYYPYSTTPLYFPLLRLGSRVLWSSLLQKGRAK